MFTFPVRTCLAYGLGGLLLCASLPAMAQDGAAETAEASPDERARAAFQSGAAHYDAGRFDEAEADFQVAYRLTGRIELLYNIFLSRRDGGHLEGARDALREFVQRRELPPDAPQARRLAALERRLETGEPEPEIDDDEGDATTQPSSVSTEVLPARNEGGGVSIPGVILVAGGGVALVTGAVLLGVAFADASAIENPEGMPTWTEDTQAAADRVPVLAGSGYVLLGVGVAALGVGIVLMVLDSGSSDAQALLRDGRMEFQF